MTPDQLTARARDFVNQAVGRLDALQDVVKFPAERSGEWASLAANLRSAQADLEAATKEP